MPPPQAVLALRLVGVEDPRSKIGSPVGVDIDPAGEIRIDQGLGSDR